MLRLINKISQSLSSKFFIYAPRWLIKDSIWRFLQILFKEGVMFVLFFYSAHILSPIEFGFLAYLMAIAGLVAIFTNFGISTAAAKYTSEMLVTDPSKVKKIFISTAIPILILFSLIVIGFSLFGNDALHENILGYLLFLPFLLFKPLSSLLDGIFRGLRQFKSLSIINIITGSFSLLIGIYLIEKFKLNGFIISLDLLYISLFLSLFFSLHEKGLSIEKEILFKVLRYSLWIGFASISFFLSTKASIFILKHFNFVLEIGHFEIVNKMLEFTLYPVIIIGQTAAPVITKIMLESKQQKLLKNYWKVMNYILLLSVILVFILYFLAGFMFQKYLPAYFESPSFTLIFQLTLVTIPLQIWGTLLLHALIFSTGNAKMTSWFTFFTSIASITIGYWTTKNYGYIGAISSFLVLQNINIIIQTIVFYFLLKKSLIPNEEKAKHISYNASI